MKLIFLKNSEWTNLNLKLNLNFRSGRKGSS